MIRRVLALIAGHLLLVAGVWALAANDRLGLGSPWRVAAFAAAFVLVGMLPMHVELTRGDDMCCFPCALLSCICPLLELADHDPLLLGGV